MISRQAIQVAERAKAIYEERLRVDLEPAHLDRFVAIEPDSGEHFLADSFAGAGAAARTAHPDRISFVFRIGQPVGIWLGEMPKTDPPHFHLKWWSVGCALATLPVCAVLGYTGNLEVDKYQGAPPNAQAILVMLGYGPEFALAAAVAGFIVGYCVGVFRRRRWLRMNH